MESLALDNEIKFGSSFFSNPLDTTLSLVYNPFYGIPSNSLLNVKLQMGSVQKSVVFRHQAIRNQISKWQKISPHFPKEELEMLFGEKDGLAIVALILDVEKLVWIEFHLDCFSFNKFSGEFSKK